MKALGLLYFGQFMKSAYIHGKIARFKRFKLREYWKVRKLHLTSVVLFNMNSNLDKDSEY